MILNGTFNNISVISWRSVLKVEKSGVPRENHRSVASHCQLYHIKLYQVQFVMSEVRSHNFSVHRY